MALSLSSTPVLCADLLPLEWESGFFGLRTARVNFSASAGPLTEAQLQAFDRIQAKVNAADDSHLDVLQAQGFRLVDGEVNLSLPLTQNYVDAGLTAATELDIPPLRSMADAVFQYSRFRAPWYTPGASARFYSRWVENAVKGTFDDICLVLREGGALRGFVTLRQVNDNDARIGLLAGRGVGDALMQAACHWSAERGLTRLWVATQPGNRAALNCYLRSGAGIENVAYWLYR
ncbi:dTDP-4-amino-4,6-dideoxy-D-galactose acyltransferase [Erwinia sp. HR93]|uniref:dTDP-4-amino-4,6-dideoxy-D-galactose acyltransferase n=1 Tax=Erwinia sp. HR93 TaxID=3094840 RepID=UPI002ADEA9B2|nr:dTDP-4-amino-4,6-dideoxy-D-galactose acyltransferase [Erwinia sp. HR93]MEA1062656.1 dTDP-4-amino-4,6-dideoxy-D-galactose acyltransferase [Erwinia sp. HR93]